MLPHTCVLNSPDSELVSQSQKLGPGWIKVRISLDLTIPAGFSEWLSVKDIGKTEARVLLQEPSRDIPLNTQKTLARPY